MQFSLSPLTCRHHSLSPFLCLSAFQSTYALADGKIDLTISKSGRTVSRISSFYKAEPCNAWRVQPEYLLNEDDI